MFRSTNQIVILKKSVPSWRKESFDRPSLVSCLWFWSLTSWPSPCLEVKIWPRARGIYRVPAWSSETQLWPWKLVLQAGILAYYYGLDITFDLSSLKNINFLFLCLGISFENVSTAEIPLISLTCSWKFTVVCALTPWREMTSVVIDYNSDYRKILESLSSIPSCILDNSSALFYKTLIYMVVLDHYLSAEVF